jgi:hypothetical protein
MKNRYLLRLLVGPLSTLLLAACGGGGSDSSSTQTTVPTQPVVVVPADPSSSISGVFDGAMNSGSPITVLMQQDGSYFLVESDTAAPHPVVAAIVGTGILTAGSFSSNNGLGLALVSSALEAPLAVTLSASYVGQQSLNGSLSYAADGQVTTFTSTYNSSYTTLPPLTALAGTYTAVLASLNASETGITLTIGKDGTLSGQLSCGCNITSTLTPRADGMAYVANLSMVGGDNILSNKTLAGNVYLDTTRGRLYIVGNIVGTTELLIFVGTKS